MISNLSIAGMVFSLAVSFLFPLILLIYMIRKHKAKIIPFFTGAVVFILFAMILEQLFHLLFIGPQSPFAETITNTPWLLGLYGGFAAGIFEETGRLLAFIFILKKMRDRTNGMMYGIGHGGIESWLLVSLTYVSNLSLVVMHKSGLLASTTAALPADQASVMEDLIRTLADTRSDMFFMAGIERFLTIIVHIGLSLLVLYAVRNRKYLFFLLAIVLHAALNFPAPFASFGHVDIVLIELWVLLFAAASLIWIVKSKSLLAPVEEPVDEKIESATDSDTAL